MTKTHQAFVLSPDHGYSFELILAEQIQFCVVREVAIGSAVNVKAQNFNVRTDCGIWRWSPLLNLRKAARSNELK